MDFLSEIPSFLLIAVGLAIVNGLKFIIEKVQERRGGGQFDWPDPDDNTEWQAPETYEQPPPAPVQRRAPERRASVPPPIDSTRTRTSTKPEPAWSTSGHMQSQDILRKDVEKPTLSRAEQEALNRLKTRGGRRRKRRSSGKSVLDLSEREFLRTQLRNPRSARHAITLTEVLGPPVALRK